MIRVNLLRSLSLEAAGPISFASSSSTAVAQEVIKEALGKLVLILVLPSALTFWWSSQLDIKQEELNKLRTEIQRIESEKGNFGEAAPIFEKYSKLEDIIKKQAGRIRELTDDRLRGVKALDALQSITPPKVWFKSIKIDGASVRASGFSGGEDGVSQLFSALNSSAVFSKFEPGAQSETSIDGGMVKSFEVSFQIGRRVEDSGAER